MARYSIYAVAYGVDPKTGQPVQGLKCASWKECESYVKGVEKARYKGFLTDTEADAWLNGIINQNTSVKITSQPKEAPQTKLNAVLEKVDEFQKTMDWLSFDELIALFSTACHTQGLEPAKVLQMITMMLYSQGGRKDEETPPWD